MSVTRSIIEILQSDTGSLSSRLQPCKLSTKDYGELIGKLLRQIAAMMASEGNFDEGLIYAQLLHYLGEEIGREPDESVRPSLLQ